MSQTAARTARMHGLWALIGIGPLEPGFHAKLLAHNDPSFRAWGVRAAGNIGKVATEIRAAVVRLIRDPSPDVRLQVVIAARKLEGVDPLLVLLDILRFSRDDHLTNQVVWQNLHPLLETRRADVAQWLERPEGKETGLGPLAPRAIERLLSSSQANVHVIITLLVDCLRKNESREAIDVLAERFRDRSLPAPLENDLRRELIKAVNQSDSVPHFSQSDELKVLLAYCGDHAGLAETRRIALNTRAKNDSVPREEVEEIRIRAVGAIFFQEPRPFVRSLVAKLLAEDDSASSDAFRAKVLDALGRLNDPELAPTVLNAFASLPSSLKPRALELMTQRPTWSKAALGRRGSQADPRVRAERESTPQASTQQRPGYRKPRAEDLGYDPRPAQPRARATRRPARAAASGDPGRPGRRPGRLQEAVRPVPQDLRRGGRRRTRYHGERAQ